MELNELEALLASLKGEESAFALYNSKGKKEIRQIAELFLATRDYNVEKLNSIIRGVSEMGPKSKRVVSLYGEKGVGKSTALSIFLLDNLLKKNIDGVVYLRYDAEAEEFKEIFNVNGADGKKVVVCMDDMAYYSSALVEGKAVNLAKGIEERARIYQSQGTKLFFYVSDITHATFISTFETKILEKVGRGDLVYKMPKMGLGRTGSTNKDEVTLSNEFYGKTYALLKGNLEFYGLGVLFGEAIREKDKVLADNPRLLKFLIKQIEANNARIEPKIFMDKEFGKQVLRSGELDSKKAIDHFSELGVKEISRYYEGLRDYARGISNEHKKMQGILKELKEDLRSLQKLCREEKGFGLEGFLSEVPQDITGKLNTLSASLNSDMKKLDEDEKIILSMESAYSLSASGKLSELWEQHVKESHFYFQRATRVVNKMNESVNKILGKGVWDRNSRDPDDFKATIRSLAHVVQKIKMTGQYKPNTPAAKIYDTLFYTLNRMANNMNSSESLFHYYSKVYEGDELVEQTNKNGIVPIQNKINYYSEISRHKADLAKFNDLYKDIDLKVSLFVSKNPTVFSGMDANKIDLDKTFEQFVKARMRSRKPVY
ncbi:MAG: hypothetical protein KGH54_03450 [Candidatus Micrarchaeota archaeon]|nr:hypothetical protein [Candidatus Micrarchaeota archaeon]